MKAKAMAWLLWWFMIAQCTLISYHTEAFVKTEVACTLSYQSKPVETFSCLPQKMLRQWHDLVFQGLKPVFRRPVSCAVSDPSVSHHCLAEHAWCAEMETEKKITIGIFWIVLLFFLKGNSYLLTFSLKWKMNMDHLLNKPYVNEVTLRVQNSS